MSPLFDEPGTGSQQMNAQNDAGAASLEAMEEMSEAQGQALPADETLSRIPGEEKKRDYVLPKCEMPPPSQLEPVESFVFNSVMAQTQDKPDPKFVQGYKAILDALRRTTDPPLNRLVLISLRTGAHGAIFREITRGGDTHAHLVHLIFRFDSTQPPEGIDREVPPDQLGQSLNIYDDGSMLDAHLNLILAMVSAKTVHLVPALTTVWRMLSDGTSLTEPQVQRLHAMLATMIRLVPRTRTALFPVIKARFPYWGKPREHLKYYCIRAYEVLDYLPSIRKEVFELVIDKSLDIDVHIDIKDNGEVSIEKKDDGKENDNELGNAATTSQTTSQEQHEDELDKHSNKLDSLLSILFNVLKRHSINQETVRQLYYEIYPVFESTILTTHKSKFVQFCVFLLCGLESGFEDQGTTNAANGSEDIQHSILHRDFASKLVEIIVDPYRASLTRQSGACYLASFISRASFVGPATVCESVSTLLRWAEAYMDTLASDDIRAADAREQTELHSLYYTVCQAAFYIMCFRGSEAIQYYKEAVAGYPSQVATGEDDDQFLPDPEHINLSTARWTRICGHELQPLRYCLESVRSEFLHVAHFYELIDKSELDRLVVDAKRISTGRVNKKAASTITTAATLEKRRRTGGVGGLGRGSNPLKSFFPFDPLLLRRSYEIIEPFYKQWNGPVEEEDVLDIDEGPGEDGPIFEMDEDSETSLDSDEEEDDAPSAEGQDYVDDIDSDSEPEPEWTTPTAAAKKEMQRQAWTETLKRPRSLSMENGSW